MAEPCRVANYAGAILADASTAHGIETESPNAPSTDWLTTSFRSMPVIGTLWCRARRLLAHPTTYRLLKEQEQLVLFPRGEQGPAKNFTERYRLRRFGLGSVEIAMRAGAPVVPIAVVVVRDAAYPQHIPARRSPAHRTHR
ncbi:MAG: hypothetical protein R2789_02050 [Microthrixaceae bacterium]